MKRFLLLGLLLCVAFMASAQVVLDTVKIYFRQGKHELELDFKDNRQVLDKINRSAFYLKKVEVVGGASPEGSVSLNKALSEKRAQEIFDYLSRYGNLADSMKVTRFIGRDWQGLLDLVKADPKVPYQKESIILLEEIIRMEAAGSKRDLFWKLVAFRRGKPYRYMYYKLFPELRASQMLLMQWEAPKPLEPTPYNFVTVEPEFSSLLLKVPMPVDSRCKSYHWAIKTNALYDLLLVPNIGVEFGFGKNWSVGANWMYGWWKHDAKHWYWRVYGGDLYVRRWLGKQAMQQALTGHHLGVYAQMLTYDFATGGRGYMGGKPGGNLWDKASYAAGIEYGYSLPVATSLNLDFSIGIGYMGGQYHEYIPMDDCYVWQTTKNRHWFGPTEAEVSLVWLLNRDVFNKKKGGGR